MDVGDYYSKSIESFRNNWKIAVPQMIASALTLLILIVGFLGILSTLSIDLSILGNTMPSTFPQINPNTVLTAVVIFLVMEILIIVINTITTAATVGMAKKIIMEGFSGLDVAWKSGIKYFPKIIAVSIIEAVIIIIIGVPLFLGLFLLFTDASLMVILVFLLGSLIFLVGAALIALIFYVVNQSIVVGEKSVIDSIKDSFHVFWSNKLTVFLVAVINLVIALAIGFLWGIILTPLSMVAGPITAQLISQIGSFLINIILVPYFVLVLTYMYIDLKNKPVMDEAMDATVSGIQSQTNEKIEI